MQFRGRRCHRWRVDGRFFETGVGILGWRQSASLPVAQLASHQGTAQSVIRGGAPIQRPRQAEIPAPAARRARRSKCASDPCQVVRSVHRRKGWSKMNGLRQAAATPSRLSGWRDRARAQKPALRRPPAPRGSSELPLANATPHHFERPLLVKGFGVRLKHARRAGANPRPGVVHTRTGIGLGEVCGQAGVPNLRREGHKSPRSGTPSCGPALAMCPRVGHMRDIRRCGRVAEGGGLLNRYRVVKPYRGFESLRLRHPSPVWLSRASRGRRDAIPPFPKTEPNLISTNRSATAPVSARASRRSGRHRVRRTRRGARIHWRWRRS